MQDTSALDIDLSAIDHNMAVLRGVVGDRCALCPIVKADAYGLGVTRVARRLASAGADMLAVYSLRQAIETAAAVNGATPVLVLMPLQGIAREDELVRLMLAGQLHLVAHDEANLATLEACAESLGVTLPVHVEVDLGMSRGGAHPDEASRMVRAIHTSRRLEMRGIFGHFSHSRTDAARTDAQMTVYESLLESVRRFMPADAYEHVASTYALARGTRFHRSMVRFGLAWMGYGLDELECETPVLSRETLRPAVRWTSSIVQAKEVPLGTSVGYGGRWTAERRSTIALVPVGYADGYPVPRQPSAVGGQSIGVRTPSGDLRFAPVVGAVNMDQITVDVTGLHHGDPHEWIGCEAELFGRDHAAPNHLPRVAAQSGLIVHEFLTRLNPRIARTTSLGAGSTAGLGGVTSVVSVRVVDDAPRASVAAG